MRNSWIGVVGLLALLSGPALADEAGRVKTVKGTAHIERSGQQVAVAVGTVVEQADRLITGADGAVGITFRDNSVLSTGPNSVLEISKFAFDTTTHEGVFESKLEKGTLSAVSGKIAKQKPEAMRIVTPSTILGVRGTEFYVQVK